MALEVMAATTKRKVVSRRKEPSKTTPRKLRTAHGGVACQKNLLAAIHDEMPAMTSSQFAVQFEMTVDQVLKHKAFALEYVRDFNFHTAALRLGYPPISAADTGYRMLHNAFVQLKLQEIFAQGEIATLLNAGQIIARFKEEANREDTVIEGCVMSSSATRIVANAHLAKIAGLFIPKPTVDPNAGRPMRQVMNVNRPANWEDAARASQRNLKEMAAVDV